MRTDAAGTSPRAVPVSRPLFEGVGVALVTLFHDDGSLDTQSTAALAGQLAELGVKAVVVAGSTGEAAALEPHERQELVREVCKVVSGHGGPPVIAGTGAPSTRQAVELTRQACDAGADGVLVLPPPGSHDLSGYYESVRKAAGGRPVLGYHFPQMSAPGLPLDVLPSLPIDGCKDSSRDGSRMLVTLATFDRPLYTGSAALLALAGPLGCTGAILALANADPERCAAAFTGDIEAQRALAVGERRMSESFPGGIKQLTADRFGTSAVTRLA